MGKFILFREMECAAAGSTGCRIIGKVLDDWGDNERMSRPTCAGFQAGCDRRADSAVANSSRKSCVMPSMNAPLGDMVGDSDLPPVLLIRRGAKSTVTVLLLGETGVGKGCSPVARIASATRRQTISLINCAALPEQLLESELFGVEKARSRARMSRDPAGSSGRTVAHCFG